MIRNINKFAGKEEYSKQLICKMTNMEPTTTQLLYLLCYEGGNEILARYYYSFLQDKQFIQGETGRNI